MKKKIAAIALLLTFTSQTAFASILGSVITSTSIEIANGTDLYKNEFLSEQEGVGKQTEYYAEYTPNKGIIPTIVTGNSIWGTRTIKEAEQYMKENGMVPMLGINASFFSLKTGIPMGHVISEGKIVSKDTESYQAIGFAENGEAFILPLSIKTTLEADETSFEISHINKYNQETTNIVNLYTDDFDDNNHSELPTLNLILGDVSGELTLDGKLTATVEEKFNYTSSIKIPEGKIVLTLNENTQPELYEAVNLLEVGQSVTISSEANDERWYKAASALGSVGETLIENGELAHEFEKGAAPRTAVGITQGGSVIFYVIDGRQSGHSYGVQTKTLAKRMQELGCVDAINLDGGGSSAISGVYPGSGENSVLNSPSDGKLRGCTNYIFLKNVQKATSEAKNLHLYPYSGHYLSGYSEEITVTATDSAYYKTDVPQGIEFSTENTESEITPEGLLTAKGDGEFTLYAKGGEAEGSAKYRVYQTPTNIDVYEGKNKLKELTAEKDDIIKLDFKAQHYYIDLKATNDCFSVELSKGLGYIENNEIIITSTGGEGSINVTAGEYTKTIPVTVLFDTPFIDTSEHWAKDMINYIYNEEIVSGYETEEGSLFRPDNNMTREEFAVIMCRFLDIDATEYEGEVIEFADRDAISDWAKSYVTAMADKGIINGKATENEINFAPKDTLTRAEAMTILGRVLGGEVLEEITFADSGEIPDWAKDKISVMVSGGFIKGYSDNTIRPNNHVTRAEAVTMLYNIMNKSF